MGINIGLASPFWLYDVIIKEDLATWEGHACIMCVEPATCSLHQTLVWQNYNLGAQQGDRDRSLSPYSRKYLNKDLHDNVNRDYFNLQI